MIDLRTLTNTFIHNKFSFAEILVTFLMISIFSLFQAGSPGFFNQKISPDFNFFRLTGLTAASLAHTLTIREQAELTRNLVASMEAVLQRRLFYRQLERDKIKSLQHNKGNFEAKSTISDLSKRELTWWENNIMAAT